MVYIQQAMNSPLECRKRQSLHYPLAIPIREDILDNLQDLEFISSFPCDPRGVPDPEGPSSEML